MLYAQICESIFSSLFSHTLFRRLIYFRYLMVRKNVRKHFEEKLNTRFEIFLPWFFFSFFTTLFSSDNVEK